MELLRLVFDAALIRAACIDYARQRTSVPDPLFYVEGLPERISIVVVVEKKRTRKLKAKPE